MLQNFFRRDWLIMVGLIVLGVLTVTAGFYSGHSTFEYALSTDARQASTRLVSQAETSLFGKHVGGAKQVAGEPVVVVAPRLFSQLREDASRDGSRDLEIAKSVHGNSFLLKTLDKYLSGWMSNLTQVFDTENHVSDIVRFAVIDPAGAVVLRSQDFKPEALTSLLNESGFRAELHTAMGLRTTRVIANASAEGTQHGDFQKILIVPMVRGDKVERIYVLDVDQSSAAAMSKVALIAVSMMTSLLIVIGYMVPAVVAFRKIRERRRAEDKLRFLAMHDPLTGLSNRVQLQERLGEALARARRRDSFLTIMCIDLDRFKEVNDTLGHRAGDILLREVAKRLRSCVRETDTIARVGGDEFVIVAEDLDEPTDAIYLARRICQLLARAFEVEGHDLAISGSVGITFAPTEGTEAETLLNNADLALYRAKNDGRNTFRFFEPEMDRDLQRRRSLAVDLRQALRNDDLSVHYQPQFDLKTGELTGYEALARWRHRDEGEVPPSEFVPIAEENGLMGMLGEWVLQEACRYARRWPAHIKLSVNVSPTQFLANNLAAVVRNTLAETQFSPERLILEITEALLLKDADETLATLEELAETGVRLAIDDFAVGYSSLRFLTRLPVEKIKIDRSFICRMERDSDMSAIVNTIIGIGKSMNVKVSAEGVESESQIRILRDAGCNEIQGFVCGRPTARVTDRNESLQRALSHTRGGWPRDATDCNEQAENEPRSSVELETNVRNPLPPLTSTGELSGLLPDPPRERRAANEVRRGPGNAVYNLHADTETASTGKPGEDVRKRKLAG
ncbi:MAG: EAL domain-containing protein [Hyphomicrobiaceae bacterium]|nr:EAL domain-containing protein [Hyphomicrobiaceae bacterium]